MGILRKLEVDRSVLASRSDFTIQRSFELLTPHSNLEKLSQGDLVSTLCHLGITCTSTDAELMIRRYDGDFDGKISFWEF
jgi:Ca2+-binding EF-hand superfamily protein